MSQQSKASHPIRNTVIVFYLQVNLVSEHIWCEDFLVRSFYLKNVQTNETRTVTQFHFLSWMDHNVPESARTLLDFRRCVNSSLFQSFPNETSGVWAEVRVLCYAHAQKAVSLITGFLSKMFNSGTLSLAWAEHIFIKFQFYGFVIPFMFVVVFKFFFLQFQIFFFKIKSSLKSNCCYFFQSFLHRCK